MKMLRLLFLVLPFLASSCAFHSGMMTGNASLSSNNFRIVKQAHGFANTTHILGIGGNSTAGLVGEARQNMYKNYKLEPGQALANVTVDFKRSFYILFATTHVYINADIVDFDLSRAAAADSVTTTSDKLQLKRDIPSLGGYNLDEEVYFKKNLKTQSGKIVDFRNDEALIEYVDHNGEKHLIKRDLDLIRKKKQQ